MERPQAGSLAGITDPDPASDASSTAASPVQLLPGNPISALRRRSRQRVVAMPSAGPPTPLNYSLARAHPSHDISLHMGHSAAGLALPGTRSANPGFLRGIPRTRRMGANLRAKTIPADSTVSPIG
jgi:hypothetical protein